MRELAAVRREVDRDDPLSLDEAINVADRISRRDFLRRGAGAGAAVLLAACTGDIASRPRPDRDGPSVAIVGAGLAGLSAAYWLTRAGVRVRVFEARDRAGGRCWSARSFAGGQIAEHGGEFIDTRHVHIQRLAGRLGLELDDLFEEGASGRWLTYVDGEIVSRTELYADADRALRRLGAVAAANGSYLAGQAGPEAMAFDERTMADWLDENLPGGLDTPLGRVIAAEQTGWWGGDPDALSATNLIDFYVVDYPGADERYTVHGGNDLIVSGLLEELPEGTVELEATLEAVHRRANGTYELVVGGRSVEADRVILTLPFTTLRDLDLRTAAFSEPKLAAIRELGMGTNAKVLLQFSEPFPMGTWSGGVLRGDDPSFGTWESGATDGPAARSHGLLTVFSGGRLGSSYGASEPHGPAPPEVVDSTLAAIDQAVPGVSESFNGRAWLDEWASDPWVKGSYAAFLPGQYTRFYGAMGAAEANAHFAGEHTSVASQGYLDGAVETGDRAAVEVLSALGKPVPAALTAAFEAAGKYRPRFPS
jgi:monoamine oxidase